MELGSCSENGQNLPIIYRFLQLCAFPGLLSHPPNSFQLRSCGLGAVHLQPLQIIKSQIQSRRGIGVRRV